MVMLPCGNFCGSGTDPTTAAGRRGNEHDDNNARINTFFCFAFALHEANTGDHVGGGNFAAAGRTQLPRREKRVMSTILADAAGRPWG